MSNPTTTMLSTLGTLRAGAGTTTHDLHAALEDVRAAVAEGQPLESVAALAQIGRDVAAPSPTGVGGTLTAVRYSPIPEADPLAPAWTRNLRPASSSGPFLDELGRQVWIDKFLLPQLVSLYAAVGSAATPRLIARVPLRAGFGVIPAHPLAGGTVWMAAQALVPGRPDNEFVGVPITGGTLKLEGVTASSGTSITLGASGKITLNLKVAAPANGTPGDGPGADASHAVIDAPATITVSIPASAIGSITTEPATATAYDDEVKITGTGAAAIFDPLSRSIVVPGTASSGQLEFSNIRSPLWKIGAVSIGRAGWALPIVVTAPTALANSADTGFLWLEVSNTVSATWTALPRPALLSKLVIGLAPAKITIWGSVSPVAITQSLRLWDEPGTDPLRQSSIEVASAVGAAILYVSQPGAESVLLAGRVTAHLDRPVEVDGGRIALRMPIGWLSILTTAAGTSAGVLAFDPAASNTPHIAFCLENALLKVRPPAWLLASGSLMSDQMVQGGLLLRFAFRALLPTLPDPYAANFDFDRTRDVDRGWANALTIWTTPHAATVAFTVQPADSAGLLGNSPQPSNLDRTPDRFVYGGRVLLDVSSNADQFGVLIPSAASSLAVQGLGVVAKASEVAVVTLPPISWEPMLTQTPQGAGDVPLPPPPHDGGPAVLNATSDHVLRTEPIPLVTEYRDAVNANDHFTARLPLPFGLIAQVQSRRVPSPGPQSTFITNGGALFLNQPAFGSTLSGGLQLALQGPANPNPHATDPTLPGYVQLSNENDYAKGVLSQNISTRLEGDFGASNARGIPLRRYDLSGYGASLLSDWHDPAAVGPAIIEARFDVFVGRTSHEVIQMQSILYPWFIRVVRTITMDRTPGGWILREDSGWVATTDGRFEYVGDPTGIPPVSPAFNASTRHTGAVQALTNVRNILLVGGQFPVLARPGSGDPATLWQAVTFDADILFNTKPSPRLTVSSGASASGSVPTRSATGWIQIDGPTYLGSDSAARVRPASAQQVFDLLQTTGSAAAPFSGTLALGGTPSDPGMIFHAARIEAACNADKDAPHLVAAVRGSPDLPRDGAWSLARLSNADTAPKALDPAFPVPLVNPNSSYAGSDRWHLADPADITLLAETGNPSMRYGLVQSLGAQRVFFGRPRVGNDPDPITLPETPQLADMGALLNAVGIFPGLSEAFSFQSLKALSVNAGEIRFGETFTIGSKAAPRSTLLADLGGEQAIQVKLEYHDENGEPTVAAITVDPAGSPRWQLSLTRVCFAVYFKGSALVSLFGQVKVDERSAPGVSDLRVRYEGLLNDLQMIFTNIQQAARFLPGGAGAGLHVGFSQGKLSVHNDFALPSLPLGAGQITDIAVAMGLEVTLSPFDIRFVAGLGSAEKPFRWIVSPLAGTGVVQVGVGGDGLDVLVQGGLGLGLAIDLGIAAGAASIALALELNTGPDPFEIRGIISGRASVDVLQGLASATITLAAGLGVIPPPELFKPPFLPPQLLPVPDKIPGLTVGLVASVSVGIHLSVCWVVDVDWDGYWQFRQDITTPAIPIPL